MGELGHAREGIRAGAVRTAEGRVGEKRRVSEFQECFSRQMLYGDRGADSSSPPFPERRANVILSSRPRRSQYGACHPLVVVRHYRILGADSGVSCEIVLDV